MVKRTTKTILTLTFCAALAASLAGLSACSLLVYALDGSTSGSGGSGGGGDDGGGDTTTNTYTLDVAAMDPAWSDHVVDSSLWRTTANIDAYATDTLVLNEDGTYELTKEMGAGPVAQDRWGATPEDKNFNKYVYYGTYTMASDGVTVTLSECTKVAAEVDIFEMSLGYDLGNYVIEYTETDDLTFGAGTCGDETVVDLMYGAYIADSGRGNCSQTVVLGTYDYGTFTFAESEEPGGDDQPGGGDEQPEEKPGYTFTSGTNEEITFTVYADGTYTFAWAANSVSESGTYAWDRAAGVLTITDPAGKEYEVTAEGGELSFTYYYSMSDQLLQAYTGSVEEMEEVICTVLYSMIPSQSGEVSLDLYSDGTYTYADPAKSVRETGTYEWDSEGVLTVTKPDGRTIKSTIAGNLITLRYTSSTGGSSQSCIGSYAQMVEAIVTSEVIYSFTPTNPAITFDLYSDGTYTFAFTTYNTSESGTWSFKGGILTITDPAGNVTTSTLSGDAMSFHYVFSSSDQLTQDYTGSASALAAAMYDAGMGTVVYSFTPGSGNTAISLDLYDNGTYRFAFSNYGVTDFGTWGYQGGAFAVTDANGKVTTATAEGDALSLYYEYSMSAQLNQTFEGSASAVSSAAQQAGLVDVIYSFTPGSGNEAISFELYENGTYRFGFASYGVYDYGTWSYSGGVFSVTDANGKVSTATISGDDVSLYYEYSMSSQLNQTFNGSASAIAAAAAKAGLAEEVYSFTPGSGNTAISFVLYDNGAYRFGFASYGVEDYGTWSYSGGVLSVTDANGKVTSSTTEGDDVTLYYEYSMSAQLNQTFEGSAAELAAAAGGAGADTQGGAA